MGKIQSSDGWSDKRYKKPSFIMTHSELLVMDKELEAYRYKKYSNFFKKELDLIDINKWIEDKGGTKKGAVVVNGHVTAEYDAQGKLITPQDCNPIYFETLQEKLRQWTDWKARKEYAQKKQMEQLNTTSLAEKFSTTSG